MLGEVRISVVGLMHDEVRCRERELVVGVTVEERTSELKEGEGEGQW